MTDPGAVAPPVALPPGEYLDLPGRGRTFVRTLPGPSGAATVVLLHGWTATADINWFLSYGHLGERYRVLAIDHRAHGRGIRSSRRFRLSDCADDAIAVCDAMGIDHLIPVGYSMGGPVAQLIWHRHRQRVRGLVLCATAASFSGTRQERLSFLGLTGLSMIARLTPAQARAKLTEQLYLQRKADRGWGEWAISEAAQHDWRGILEAGAAIGSFDSTPWISQVDVPTSVVITMNDTIVSTRRQERLFEAIHSAEAFRVDGDHGAAAVPSSGFVPTLLRAIRSVDERARIR